MHPATALACWLLAAIACAWAAQVLLAWARAQLHRRPARTLPPYG